MVVHRRDPFVAVNDPSLNLRPKLRLAQVSKQLPLHEQVGYTLDASYTVNDDFFKYFLCIFYNITELSLPVPVLMTIFARGNNNCNSE